MPIHFSRMRGLLAFGLAILVGSGADAQIPTSSAEIRRRPGNQETSELALSDRVFREAVACVVERDPTRTRNLLNTIPGTYEEGRILNSFTSRLESCFNSYRLGSNAMSYPSNMLRGVIAEIYYNRQFPNGLTPAAADSSDAVAAWAEPRLTDGQTTQAELIHATGRCVIMRQPAAVAAVLRTQPITPEENAAMRGLAADLGACLDSGVEFTASPQSLRALLAEAALHYAEDGRSGFARVDRELAGGD